MEKQNAYQNSEAFFEDAEERLRAQAAYYGLCSWLDHNVGRIVGALESTGMLEDTTIVYTSDHGDNLGARGLWGKSNMYQESVSVPVLMAGPGVPVGVCDTPVHLLDVAETIARHFVSQGLGDDRNRDLLQLATSPADLQRVMFSEYHAGGAVSGAFMVKKGRWKYCHYVGFAPELFDLETDPEELRDLAADPAHADTLARMRGELEKICDPLTVDAEAFADQAALIARHGGRDKALTLGAPGATPPPQT